MHKLDEKGDLLIPLVLVSVLLISSLAFGFWAFTGRQDYKNNVDKKIDEAVKIAEENLSVKKDAEFAEQYKLPNTTYQGPAAYGTLGITYPKTWSVYVDEDGNDSKPLSGIMHPKFVPATSDTNYALRFEVLGKSYESELKSFESAVRGGRVTVAAYRLPKVESVLGSKITGEIQGKKQGVLILLPQRDKTIRIWTEGSEFRGDFEKVLESLTFVP
jgi:hypothetical protein